mmetsp:Transcript_26771/g.77303  ORF Transcript_26771/g.77303 Transcript_26771/m.77303 type:complete len:214 (+) Transcript_26771:69-710(+)
MSGGLYSVLGVSRTASKSSIKAAYLRLAKKLHPDVNKGAEAPQKFQKVREAYEVLSDDARRREHDRILGAGGDAAAHGHTPPSYGSRDGMRDPFNPNAQMHWHTYSRARQYPGRRPGPDLRWQQQQAEEEFRQRMNATFDQDRYRQTMMLSFLRVAPLLAPLGLVVLLLNMRRGPAGRHIDQAGSAFYHDKFGRAFMRDAYGNDHRMPDFDRV